MFPTTCLCPRPPLRHTFHPEPGNTEEMSARKSCLHVELECTCMREQLLGDVLCFPPPCSGQAERKTGAQPPKQLLQGILPAQGENHLLVPTPGASSLVASASVVRQLPDGAALPQLLQDQADHPLQEHLSIEMMLRVQLNSDTFLSLE